VCAFVFLCVCACVYLSVYLSFCLSVCLSICLPVPSLHVFESVMSRTNESCHVCMYARVVCYMHAYTSHVMYARMNESLNESCHICTHDCRFIHGVRATYESVMSRRNKSRHVWIAMQSIHPCRSMGAIQGGEGSWDPLSCRSFSTKEPLNTGHFCGKWPIKIRDPMSLCHPVVYVAMCIVVHRCVVSRVKTSCLVCISHVTYRWVTSHMEHSFVNADSSAEWERQYMLQCAWSHMNTSWHVQTRHVSYAWVMSLMNESRLTWSTHLIMQIHQQSGSDSISYYMHYRIWIRHGTREYVTFRMHESCHL